jgi:hypothetical protein
LCSLLPDPSYRRVPVNTPIVLQFKGAGAIAQYTVRNLSAGGLMVAQGAFSPPQQDPTVSINAGNGVTATTSPASQSQQAPAYWDVPPPNPNTPPQINFYEAAVWNQGGATAYCHAFVYVVPLPSCAWSSGPSPIDWNQSSTVSLTAIFQDALPTDVQTANVQRNSVALPANVSGLPINQQPGTPNYLASLGTLTWPEPSNVSPNIDKNSYTATLTGFGGTANCNSFDFGLKATCGSQFAPNPIFFTQSSTFSFSPQGPWTTANVVQTPATWTLSSPPTGTISPHVFPEQAADTTQTWGPVSAPPYQAGGLNLAYNMNSTVNVTNWAGTNSCMSSLAVQVPGNPSCQLSGVDSSGNPVANGAMRLLNNALPLTVSLGILPNASDGTTIYQSITWTPGATYTLPGATPSAGADTSSWGPEIAPGYFAAPASLQTTASASGVGYTANGQPSSGFSCSYSSPIACALWNHPADSPPKDGTQTMQRLYRSLLGRSWNMAVDGSYFLNQLAVGTTIESVKAQIRASQEYANRGGQEAELVTFIYRSYFNFGSPNTCPQYISQTDTSQCDATSAYWIWYFKTNGMTPANIRYACQQFYNASNQIFPQALDDLSQESLGQNVDFSTASAVAPWDLQAQLEISPESANFGGAIGKLSIILYQVLLGRQPVDVSELNYWNAIRSNSANTNPLIAQAFRASPEYASLGGCSLPAPALQPPLCSILRPPADHVTPTSWVWVPWYDLNDILNNLHDGYVSDGNGGQTASSTWPDTGLTWRQIPFSPSLYAPSPDGYYAVTTVGGLPADGHDDAGNLETERAIGNPTGSPWNGNPWYVRANTIQGVPWVGCNDPSVCPSGSSCSCFMEFTDSPTNKSDINFSIDNVTCQIYHINYRKHGCLAPETRVRLADGSDRRADRVRQGDWLWNPLRRAPVRVASVTAGPEKIPLIELVAGGHTLHATREHPIPTDRGWLPAKRIRAGDRIRDESGSPEIVTSVRELPVQAGQQVWNFTLDVTSPAPEDHAILAEGWVTGDLTLQNRMESGYTP